MVEADQSDWRTAARASVSAAAPRLLGRSRLHLSGLPSIFWLRGRIDASTFVSRCFWLLLADFVVLGLWVTFQHPRGLGLWPWGLEALALPLTWAWVCVQVQRLRAVGHRPWFLLLGLAPRVLLLLGTLLAGLGLLPDRVPPALLGVAVAPPAPQMSEGAVPRLREALEDSALQVADSIGRGRETPEQVAVRSERARVALDTGGDVSREDLEALIGSCTLGVAFGHLSPEDASSLVAQANRRLASMASPSDEELRNFYRKQIAGDSALSDRSLQAPPVETPSFGNAPWSGKAMLLGSLAYTLSTHGLTSQDGDERSRNQGAAGALMVFGLSLLVGACYRVWLACAPTVERPASSIVPPERGAARGIVSLDGHLSRGAFIGRWLLWACVGGPCLIATFNLGLAYSADWVWWLGIVALLLWSWVCMQAQRLRAAHLSLAWMAVSVVPLAIVVPSLMAGLSTARSTHAPLWLSVSGLTAAAYLTWLCVMPSRGSRGK